MSNLKTISLFLGLCLGANTSAMAAPACRSLLIQPVISKATLEQTITSLAKFKMTLDLERARGVSANAGTIKYANEQFQRKFADFKNATKDIMTEGALRESIAEKINELQGNQKESAQQESLIREEQGRKPVRPLKTAAPKYKLSKSIYINKDIVSGALSMSYIPSQKAALFDAGDHATLISMKTRKTQVLFEGCDSLRLSENREKAYVLHDQQLKIYDFSLGKFIREIDLVTASGDKLMARIVDVSPEEKSIALLGAWDLPGDRQTARVTVFDIGTGSEINSLVPYDGVIKNLSEIQFINEESIFALNQENNTTRLMNLNIRSNQYIEKDYGPAWIRVSLSQDRSQVIVAVQPRAADTTTKIDPTNRIDIFDSNNLEQVRSSLLPKLQGPFVWKIPFNPNYIMMSQDGPNNISFASIFSIDGKKNVFNFDKKYTGDSGILSKDPSRGLERVDFGVDGSLLINSFSRKGPENQMQSLELWQEIGTR